MDGLLLDTEERKSMIDKQSSSTLMEGDIDQKLKERTDTEKYHTMKSEKGKEYW